MLLLVILHLASLTFNTESEAVENHAINVLATFLNLEVCDLYMLDLTDTQLSELSESSLTARPIYVVDRHSVSSITFAKSSVCQALVHNVRQGVLRDEFGNMFQRRYVISLLRNMIDSSRKLSPNVPTFIFTPGIKGDTVDVRISCPFHKDLRRLNVWQPQTGFVLYPPSSDYQYCPNALREKLVEVSAFGLPPYILTSAKKEISGIDVEVLDIIAKKMRFRYRVTSGETWGNRINSTLWTGVTGKVLSGEAQLGIGHVIMNDERKAAVDFTTALYNENLYFVTTKPKAMSPYLNIVHPFSPSAWLAVLGSLALATSTVFVFNVFYSDSKFLSWQNFIAFYRVQMLQSGVILNCKKTTPHMTFGLWCVFAFFINSFYICNFRSYLTQVKYEKPVETAEDMVRLGRGVFLAPGSVYQNLFSQSPNAAMRDLYKSYIEKNLSYTYENGFIPKYIVDEMITSGGGFLMAKYPATIYLKTFDKMYGYIPMRIGKTIIFPFYSGFTLAKKSPWKEEMDMIILRLIQGGIITRSEDNSISPRYLREETPDTSPIPFKVAHVFGALFALVIGTALCLIIFLIEIVFDIVYFSCNNAGVLNLFVSVDP